MAKRAYRHLDDAARSEIYRLKMSGYSNREIAARTGSAAATVNYVVRPLGGVHRRELLEASRDGRLSLADRVEIYAGIRAGDTFTAIAGRIGMNVSTVSREVGGRAGRARYEPGRCHVLALARAKRPKACKLSLNPALVEVVEDGLRQWWSPAQISGQLHACYPDNEEMQVSPETIYKSLYVQGRGELRRELAACLRSGRAVRQPRGRLERRGRIPDAVSISERPAEADDRSVPGHWEGDLIIGKANKSAIGTLVERSTRFVILLHLPDGYTALKVREAMAAAIVELPSTLKRSVTWDRGSEMAEHAIFSVDTGVEVYFCDPHSPWQRGSNENTNGLLRQYFPKSTDLSQHSAADLQAAADSLNGRPRKTLGWATPTETLTRSLATTG